MTNKTRTRGQVRRSNGGGQSDVGRLAQSLRRTLAGKTIDDLSHVSLMALIAEAQGSTLNRTLARRTTDAAPPNRADATGETGSHAEARIDQGSEVIAKDAETATDRDARPTAQDLVETALAYEAEAFASDDEIAGSDLVDWFCDWRRKAMAAIGNGRPDGTTKRERFNAPEHSWLTIHDRRRFEVVQRLPATEGNPETGERLWLVRIYEGTMVRAYANEIWRREDRGRPEADG